MYYEHTVPAVFSERPNRFIAYAVTGGRQVACHVKNTGRCKELLLPGAQVILQHHPDALSLGRKTEYSLISVYKETAHGRELINMDSQAPNQAAWEWVSAGGLSAADGTPVTNLRREVTHGGSRFDLAFTYGSSPAFLEVKGVTLEQDGIARFPDAPTLRGVKHLQELERAAAEGFQAYVLFVIAMKGVRSFEPNEATHPEFARALSHAASHGVHVLAYDCDVTENTLRIRQPVLVNLR